MRTLMFISMLFLACSGCDDDNGMPFVEFETSFAGMEQGRQRIYQVDSIIYNRQLGSVRSSSNTIREVVNGTFINAENQSEYRIERSHLDTATGTWTLPSIWTAYLDSSQFIRREGNLRYVNLQFPPEVNSSWDGLAFLDSNADYIVGGESIQIFQNWPTNFAITSRQAEEEIGGHMFQDVITVEHADLCAIVQYRYSIEKYAKGVGLVYKEMWILDSQDLIPVQEPCNRAEWLNNAQKGFVITQILMP